MKRNLFLIALSMLAIIGMMAACKTTEENYRAAYEKAKEKEREGIDGTIYDKIRREALPETMVIDGDSVGMKREYVAITPDLGAAPGALHRYSVVAAQFKQLFHAKSMKKRLIDAGYPATLIVETREPLYYVLPISTDIFNDALDTLRILERQPPFKLQEDCPWILRAASR